MLAQRPGSRQHHAVGHPPCARRDHAKADRGEDEDVVALRDGDGTAAVPHGFVGEPVATRARPSVQRIRSPAAASERSVGLESGKMTGRATLRAISRTIGSVNAPPTVESPIRMVASIWPTTSANPIIP